MADVVTFDPDLRHIIEIDAGGDNVLDFFEIYSEWKVWLKTGSNSMHAQAIRYVGGDAISSTQQVGTTYFMLNSWRIRPAESSHRLTINGNIFTDPAGESIFVPTLGAFTVNAEISTSNLIDIVLSGVADFTAADRADLTRIKKVTAALLGGL